MCREEEGGEKAGSDFICFFLWLSFDMSCWWRRRREAPFYIWGRGVRYRTRGNLLRGLCTIQRIGYKLI